METPVSVPPPIEPGSKGQGCARNALIGCGAGGLVILALLVGGVLYIRHHPGVATDLMMRQIEGHWGPDVTEQDKSDLRAAYADLRAALNEQRVNERGLQKIQLDLSRSRGNQISREQVRRLTQDFREAASGTPSPGAAPAGTPAPTPFP